MRGRGRRREGREKDLFELVLFFIRLNGKKNENKSFFVSFRHFSKKMSRASFFSGLSKIDR